jgi:hypothetical protein
VPVEQRREHRGQLAAVNAGRQVEHGRHGEPVEAAAQFQEVAGDRQMRREAHATAVQLLQHQGAGAAGGELRQFGDVAELEDLPRGDLHPAGPRPGDHLDRADRVPAHGEEVVVHADPVDA